MLRKALTSGGFLLGVVVAACGAPDPSEFGGDDDPSNAPQGTAGTAGAGGTFNLETDGGAAGGDGGASGDGSVACAATTATAEPLPAYLVFMFDRSGSMKDNNKWSSCAAAFNTFVADSRSKGIQASLQFFPLDGVACSGIPTYTNPLVPMQALPSSGVFQAAIAAQSFGEGTPTFPALSGAVKYAKQVAAGQAAQTKGKVAVVLITDGEPNGCDENIGRIANISKAVASTIPTYVIGVGNITALNQIAVAGGTQSAFIVDALNPTKTSEDLSAALLKIRALAAGCEYQVPAPPAGKELDLATVNVVLSSSSSAATLAYDKDCSQNGQGWTYDDPTKPTKIRLCKAACDTLGAGAKIDIQLGCVTKGTTGSIPR
jgi:hypothetical protein